MNTLEIAEKGITVEYASGWHELTDDEFSYIMKNWIKLIDDKITPDEFNLIILYKLLGLKYSPFDLQKDKRLTAQQLEDKFSNIWMLTNTLDWLIRVEEDENGKPVGILNYTGVEQHYPFIDVDSDTLAGPSDCMLDITFGEYRAAWRYFETYSISRNDTDLDHFIACLYRPMKKNRYGETIGRQPFNPDAIEKHVKKVAEIPFWQKYAITLWFGNCDKYIKENELELDGKPITFAQLFNFKTKTDDVEVLDENDLGLTGLLYMIAESGIFGTVEEINKTNYIDILLALLYWKQKADKEIKK
jgi:hypothetical protein